jgi:exodeoxyribonuclease V alpha subunit
VLVGPRLYLRRYWEYEQAVSAGIQARLAPAATPGAALPLEALRQTLGVLFPPASIRPDWQKLACAMAARSAFAIVTGGPGTGKTTTVVRLLAVLQALALAATAPASRPVPCASAWRRPPARPRRASTNPSPARWPASIWPHCADGERGARRHSRWTVTTLHRLLGSRPDTRRTSATTPAIRWAWMCWWWMKPRWSIWR